MQIVCLMGLIWYFLHCAKNIIFAELIVLYTIHLNYVYFQVDALTDSLEHMKEKYQSAQAEDRSMSEKMMTVERCCILET